MPLIVKIVPDSSIVGMILETPEPMRVVRSDQKGVMQHLTFSWQVSGNDFEYLPQVSPSSQLFNRSLNGWLESLSTEDRERAVDALFSVLRSSHADSISDLMAAGLKAVPTMINTFVGLSEADRRHLIEAMGLLMAAVPVPFLAVAVSCPNPVSPTEKNGQFAYFPIIRLTIRPTIIHITHIDIVPNKR